MLLAIQFAAGCASELAYRQAIADRDAEIKALREERTAVKNSNRDLSQHNKVLDSALAEANARLLSEPTRESGQSLPELDDAGIGYGMRDGNLVISIPSEITFDSGKADLAAGGKQALAAVAKTLKEQHPEGEYWVEGHTDSDPIAKSKFPTNRDLSLARAMAVLHYLVEGAGIPDGQCVVAGWGEYRPVAQNDSAKNKSKNRRVEIVVHGAN
jgi:chemotaxis protein MotB